MLEYLMHYEGTTQQTVLDDQGHSSGAFATQPPRLYAPKAERRFYLSETTMKSPRTTSCGILNNFFRKWWFIFAVVLLGCDRRKGSTNVLVSAAGNEKATLNVEPFAPDVRYRQDVCDRYEGFRAGKVEPKDLLQGMKLNALFTVYSDGYFNYDEEDGINPDYPGLTAVLMDELARRAGFTWRDSFGVTPAPDGNHSWTDLLVWGVDSYDVLVDWWAQSVERMNLGVAFLEEWYDSSIILIRKEATVVVSDEINFFNWIRPYDNDVWYLTIFTLILSAFVYQMLEYLAKEREDRTLWKWTTDNLYKSFLGFTQEFQYEAQTSEAKLFGFSMAFWALLMTATYTANLASLLVSTEYPAPPIASISEAVISRTPICTWKGVNSDTYIKLNMPTAIRVQKETLEDVYEGLRKGECGLAAEVEASWEGYRSVRKYNPTCNLERVSAVVRSNKAGFASKGDAGFLCTSIIGIVINLHMAEMIADGFVEDAWARENKLSQDIDCNAYRPDLVDGQDDMVDGQDDMVDGQDDRRLLPLETAANRGTNRDNEQLGFRRLKGAVKAATGGAVAASDDDGGNSEKLTVDQMIGTFLIHWLLMSVALMIGISKFFYKSLKKCGKEAEQSTGGASTFNDESHETFPRRADEETFLTGHDAAGLNKSPEKETDVHEQLKALRNSQARMQADQSLLLQEQRMLKDHIGMLVSLLGQQQREDLSTVKVTNGIQHEESRRDIDVVDPAEF